MRIVRLDSSSTWKSQEEVQEALAAQPRRILVGLEWNEAYVCSSIMAFEYGDHWRILYDSELTFTTQAGYYEMVDVTNALSAYERAAEVTIFLHTVPFVSFSSASTTPESVLQAMIDECYMVFNERNFLKLLSHYDCFKNPVAEYPIETDADICGA